MEVYLVNLGRYNSDGSTGDWFRLPIDYEDVKERLRIAEDYERKSVFLDTQGFPNQCLNIVRLKN